MSKGKLVLPTLRARMGDWIYYVTIMSFSEISKRVSMVDEIHKSKGLRGLIQREVKNRTVSIVEYLKTQDQRFFNALIIGLYGGKPSYQELDVMKYEKINEEELNYLSKTFGILILSGKEKLFAIDGQHRIKAIKDCLIDRTDLENEEITVIFVAHRNTNDGLIRTRRLFSTLNRYAKPVSKSEIIAIDEEDNNAIITRNLVEDFEMFKDIILFNQNRSINSKNRTAFTNIIVLYDFVTTILTDQKIYGHRVSGENYLLFTHRRASEEKIKQKQKTMETLFLEIFSLIPSLKTFIKSKNINREDISTSLLFRPIGQNILYQTLKVAMDKKKKKELLNYFVKDTFNLENKIWNSVFYDDETGRIKTDKALQRYAFYLILKNIGIDLPMTKRDKEVYNNFNINPLDI